MIWFCVFSISAAVILANGIDYVSWPRLLPPTDIINYTGPGYRSAHHGKGFRFASKGREGLEKSAKWLRGKKVKVSNSTGGDGMEMGTIKSKKRSD